MKIKNAIIAGCATTLFATSSAWAVNFSDSAERLKDMTGKELRTEYHAAGEQGFSYWKSPGPAPLGEEAIGAAQLTALLGNSLVRNFVYPLAYHNAWAGKRFFQHDNNCATDRSNSSFTINNKAKWAFLPLTWGKAPAEFYLREGTIADDRNDTWFVNYVRKSPQLWYLTDELRLIDYNHNVDQGTWMGFMMWRFIPGMDRINYPVATWIIDRIGAADCMRDRFELD